MTLHLDVSRAPRTDAIDAADPLDTARTVGLRILVRAEWPAAQDTDAPPAVPGFILSTFNPLVVEVADRCLRQAFASPPLADPQRGRRVGILLASCGGDQTTARVLAEAVERGERVPPLLFFQSNPNAVLGYVAARWRLSGPVISLSPLLAGRAETRSGAVEEALDEALAATGVLIGDADADEALVIAAELCPDRAVALFVAGER